MVNSTTASEDISERRTPIWVIQMILYCTIIVVGSFGNGIICWNVFTNKQRRISEYLIANLAVTDLATCLISVPFDFIERVTGDFPFGSIMCFMIYPFQTILMAVSVITLLCMSLERYRIVMAPLRPRMTAQIAKFCIILAWAVPVIVITPYALVLRLEGKHCLEIWPENWYVKVFTLSVFVLFFVIPLFAIGFSYIRAGRKLQRDLVRFRKMSDTRSRTHAIYAQKRALQKLQITKIFILAFVVFTVCMFPNHVMWLWHDFGNGWKNKNFREILVFSNILTYVNSAVDPFIFRQISIQIGSNVRGIELCIGRECHCCLIVYALRINSLVAERQNAIRKKHKRRSRSSRKTFEISSSQSVRKTKSPKEKQHILYVTAV
ncbi:neuropeptide Y receptor type 2-like [Actinia tenebrosa]|uniref:Neuropeptide Y receptor type 2-like n=1 Tax=Actinia tenebrosa TaxID=6105 RepID=A0A6P8IJS7_ACTTE|nr:neuropeptide Y receptor type 2-like [Actinia tenebrosa]